MDFSMRIGIPADRDVLAGFNRAMAQETENRALEPAVVEKGVAFLLENPIYGFYLLCESGPEVLGTAMVTTEWSDWRDGFFWWIQSVYVKPDSRRKGVYRALYDEVRRLARTRSDVLGFRLYVEKDNHIARTVYTTLGMEETSYRLYEAVMEPAGAPQDSQENDPFSETRI